MSENVEDALELATDLAYVEKLRAEQEHFKWQAERERLAFEQEQLAHKWALDGHYTFNREVTEESAEEMLEVLSVWHNHDPHMSWVVHLNSVGGQIFAGTSIIDELIGYSRRGGGTHHTTVLVRGVALSMGSMILQAGDYRAMGRNSRLMIHKGSGGEIGTADQIIDAAEWWRQDTDMMVDYFLDRTEEITRREFMEKIDRRDWWLNAQDAYGYGFIDGIF